MLYIEVVVENTLIILLSPIKTRGVKSGIPTYAKCLFLKGVYGVASVKNVENPFSIN